ncbi:hypothetical protein [Joostella sp. CR20]|uniref:hypothetical protein n=1 Tax=Joostella sp. CR20 TaxID=2804312 RepID=UPI00313E1738
MSTLTKEIAEIGISKETELSLKETFDPFFNQADQWKEKAFKIIVKSADETELMQQAREARLALKNIRVEVEKKRKELKEESLRKGKAIDGVANVIKYLIQPIENHLKEQEDFVKIHEEKQKAELKEKRELELLKYDVDSSFYNLKEMPEESYLQLLENSKNAFEKAKEEEKRLEALRIENERLNALESERKIQIAPYAQFVSESNDLRNMSDESFENLLKSLSNAKRDYEKEQERIRIENERLKKEKEEQEAIFKKEREAKKKLEAEIKAKQQAEEKAKRELEAKARQEEEARVLAEKEARLAPDKQKLQELALNILKIQLPEVKSEEAKEVLKQVQILLNKTSNYIKEKSIEI